jgi:hypothetical protein
MTVTRTQTWPGECSKKILVRIIPDNLNSHGSPWNSLDRDGHASMMMKTQAWELECSKKILVRILVDNLKRSQGSPWNSRA